MVRAGVTSYRQLPVTLYQIRTKFRDEIRPRFGLMRGREFLMYDGYSFDADVEGLDRSYRAQDAAYRRIFERCGLDFTVVEADSGAIGGSASQEFMVLAETGEDAVVRCAACGYGANLEKAETGQLPAPWEDETMTGREDVSTPDRGGIDLVVEFLGITASRMIKCLVYKTEKGFVVALVRGDLDANEVALKRALGVEQLAAFRSTGTRRWICGHALRPRESGIPARDAASPWTWPAGSRSGTSSSSERSTRSLCAVSSPTKRGSPGPR